jgi:hypothetical protein
MSIRSTSPETLFNFSVPMLNASHRALIMSRSSRRDVPVILVKIKEDNNDMTPTTTQRVDVKSHSMKRLTPLLQDSYQHCKWQTVAGVITREAWV